MMVTKSEGSEQKNKQCALSPSVCGYSSSVGEKVDRSRVAEGNKEEKMQDAKVVAITLSSENLKEEGVSRGHVDLQQNRCKR